MGIDALPPAGLFAQASTLCLLGIIYYEISRAVERAWEDAVTRVPAATKSPGERWAERPIGM